MMSPLGIVLAVVVGVVLGLLGGGGSILTVPIFVYVLHYDPKSAIAMSLPVVGLVSLIGVVGHWRAGRVALRTALAFGVVAVLGALGGSWLARFVSGTLQLALFGGVMLTAAVFMFRSASANEAGDSHGGMRMLVLVPVGLLVGMLTGLVGVGGGFMIVPALVLLAHIPMKQAVGTSLLVIAMNAFAAFAGYLGRVPMDWPVMATFAALAIAGIVAGSWLVRFVPQQMLKRAFAMLLVIMGGWILYTNRAAVIGATAPSMEAPSNVAQTPV